MAILFFFGIKVRGQSPRKEKLQQNINKYQLPGGHFDPKNKTWWG